MKSGKISKLIKYAISSAFALLMAWVYFSLRLDSLADFRSLESADRFRMLSDAFLIPGGLLLMSGLLIYLSNQGALDGIGYALHFAVRMLIPGKALEQERYSDYVQRKREKEQHGYAFLPISGAFFLSLSILFTVLYYYMV